MRRRAHFEFLGTNSAIITTVYKQRKFDLNEPGIIDLITLKRVSHEQIQAMSTGIHFDPSTREVWAKQDPSGLWQVIGEARARDFWFFYRAGNKHETTNEGLFEVTLKEK